MNSPAPSIDVTIYHNPACGTSRNTLALLRNAGIEPTVIEYLKAPPNRAGLVSLLQRMGGVANGLIRRLDGYPPRSVCGRQLSV
jgi:arsenate reductase